MNTQMETVRSLYDHPPQPDRTVEAHPVRRVGALDRAAMYLGVALIRWGRRPIRASLLERLGFNAETDEKLRALERVRDSCQAERMTRIR